MVARNPEYPEVGNQEVSMKSKYFVPAATMIAGLLVWIVFLILCEKGDVMNEWPRWLGAVFCLVSGVLIVYSGIRCKRIDGPGAGGFVRTAVLLVMAAVTWWRIGVDFAIILAAAAVVMGVIALRGCRTVC